jgi:hypothetical protein
MTDSGHFTVRSTGRKARRVYVVSRQRFEVNIWRAATELCSASWSKKAKIKLTV